MIITVDFFDALICAVLGVCLIACGVVYVIEYIKNKKGRK